MASRGMPAIERDRENARAGQQFLNRCFSDCQVLINLYDQFSRLKCQYCDSAIVLPTKDDLDHRNVWPRKYHPRDLPHEAFRMRCWNGCMKYTGVCSRRDSLLATFCSSTSVMTDFCVHTQDNDPYDKDIARLFALWCILGKFDHNRKPPRRSEESCTCDACIETPFLQGPADMDFHIMGNWAHSAAQQVKATLSALECLIDARPSTSTEVERSLFRSSSLLPFFDGVLESACVTKFASWDTCYLEIFLFLIKLLKDEDLKWLVLEPRLGKAHKSVLLSPQSFHSTYEVEELRLISTSFIDNVDRLYREVMFYPNSQGLVVGEINIFPAVATLYNLVMATDASVVYPFKHSPDVFPQGKKFDWDENILDGHKFSDQFAKLIKPCPDREKAVMNNLIDIGSKLQPGIFLRGSSACLGLLQALIVGERDGPFAGGLFLFDIFLDEHFPTSAPHIAFTQEDSSDEVAWHKINPYILFKNDAKYSVPITPGQWIPSTSNLADALSSVQQDTLGYLHFKTRYYNICNDPEEPWRISKPCVYFTQFKTFVNSILFWLACERNHWTDVTDLYWRCNGLNVLDIISQWFKSNPLLLILQAKSMNKSIFIDRRSNMDNIIASLYGHISSKFWVNSLQTRFPADSASMTCTHNKVVPKGHDMLSLIHKLIESKFWVNAKGGTKLNVPCKSPRTVQGRLWYRDPAPILFRSHIAHSILPWLPIAFHELPPEFSFYIGKMHAYREYFEECADKAKRWVEKNGNLPPHEMEFMECWENASAKDYDKKLHFSEVDLTEKLEFLEINVPSAMQAAAREGLRDLWSPDGDEMEEEGDIRTIKNRTESADADAREEGVEYMDSRTTGNMMKSDPL